ncbi:MAG TPA: Re/Si-specific NAD(P)(+) transhydrogenase subunit alpha [Lentimicrobium sp.]|nr:Re/Si-specific NAD(P)(+) transhydrogenase subunit alpha [Lentimicrobium sp.]
MTIGILKESGGENRVAMLPESVETLIKMNVKVLVETGAGANSFAADSQYEAVGAKISSKKDVIADSDLVIKIKTTDDDVQMLKEGQVLMSVLNPYFDFALVKKLAEKNVTAFSMDIVPRTTRAQAMDILSSMATVAGYKAVLTAANTLPKFFPMFMTAAGTIKPANMLILGAGVAGLQAIASARKLGAVVYVFDVRAAVKEEVMGLGGKFVEVEGAIDDKAAGGYAVEQTEEFKARQAKAIHDQAVKSDVIIATAQIPGRRAPLLIRKETVEAMRPGSVIIDLAASTGGNCELTQDNQTVIHNGVKIIGNSQFASEMPTDSSRMFGKNMINFLKLIITKEGALNLNWEDDLVKGTAVAHDKQIVNDRVKSLLG